jgi:hypothetical protein
MPYAAAFLLIAALYLKMGEWLLPSFASLFQPEGLLLEEAAALFFSGSLAASIFFFALPVLCASLVTPMLIHEHSTRIGNVGQAAGEVAAAGTLGSLVGVFGTTFFLLPFGVPSTLFAVTLALAFAALSLCRNRLVLALVGVLALTSLLVLLYPAPAFSDLPSQAKLLETRTSSYQTSRVIEQSDGTRWLQVNEGLDSFQSIWKPNSLFPGGYYDLFALAPVYANARNQESFQAWLLGAGTASAVGPLTFPLGDSCKWSVIGVELDPDVIELGQKWMPLPEPLAQNYTALPAMDARAALRVANPNSLDCVLLDAYANQFEIPVHLASVEFFSEVASRLRDGGVFAMNIGAAGRGAPFLQDALCGTLSQVFADLRVQRVPWSRNRVIFARKGLHLPPLAGLSALLPSGLPASLGASCLPGQVVDGAPKSYCLLLDAKNPLISLQWQAWWEALS